MFKRQHHQIIAKILGMMNAKLLLKHHCLFGGGTVIALRFDEYRESVDIDFLVSEIDSYRNLRQLLTGPSGISSILVEDAEGIEQLRPIRADQYGIRTMLGMGDNAVKFEIILEGRIQLELPGPEDVVCGIATLTLLDMATSKLLANSDRWCDSAVFGRDLIDLAMMEPSRKILQAAIAKAESAYGASIKQDLNKAILRMYTEDAWLDRCIEVLSIDIPKALVWQKIRVIKQNI